MAHIRQILANLSISVAEFKQSPKTVIKAAKNEPIAVIINDRPAFYCVPADILESLYQKVYEMNDMALQNIEQLDTEEPLSPAPANDEFGTNDVFEAIEDDHEAKRSIHNESLVDPLNTQVADPLDEEVAHQINLSIDQHLKNLQDQEFADDYDDYEDDFDEYEDEDDGIPPQRTSSYGRFVKSQGTQHATGSRTLTNARTGQRPCALNAYGQRTNLLDKLNQLSPNQLSSSQLSHDIGQGFDYPYASSGAMLDSADDTTESADLTLNQNHAEPGLSNVETDTAYTENTADTANVSTTEDAENLANAYLERVDAAGALNNFASAAPNAASYKPKTSRHKAFVKSRTDIQVKTAPATLASQAAQDQGQVGITQDPASKTMTANKRKTSRRAKTKEAPEPQAHGENVHDTASSLAQPNYADANYTEYSDSDYPDIGFDDFAVSGSMQGSEVNRLENIDPIMHTNYANRRLEDKAALREIISDVKQEIKDSMHARRLIRNPYDMPLDKVARTYSPYTTPKLTESSGDMTQVRKNTRRKILTETVGDDKVAKTVSKLTLRPAPLTQAAKLPIRRKSTPVTAAPAAALSTASALNPAFAPNVSSTPGVPGCSIVSTVSTATTATMPFGVTPNTNIGVMAHTNANANAGVMSSTDPDLSTGLPPGLNSDLAPEHANVTEPALAPSASSVSAKKAYTAKTKVATKTKLMAKATATKSAKAPNTNTQATVPASASATNSTPSQAQEQDQALKTKQAAATSDTKTKSVKPSPATAKATKSTKETKTKSTKAKGTKGTSDASDAQEEGNKAKQSTRSTRTKRSQISDVSVPENKVSENKTPSGNSSKSATADKSQAKAQAKTKASVSVQAHVKSQDKAQAQDKASPPDKAKGSRSTQA